MRILSFFAALFLGLSAQAQSRDCKNAAVGAINSQVRMGTMHGTIEDFHAVSLPQREQVAQSLEKSRGDASISPMRKQAIISLLRSNDTKNKFYVANMNSFGKPYSILVVNDAASCAPEGIYQLQSSSKGGTAGGGGNGR